jgi:hypothetical protein
VADNVTIDNGALTDFDAATDDVAGKHYQRVKIDVGGDGASVPVEGKMPVGGDVAHDAADSGNPVKIGGRANEFSGAAVAEGDRVEAWFGLRGALHTIITDPDGNPVYTNAGHLVVEPAQDMAAMVQGWELHDDADEPAGVGPRPVKIGGYASAVAPTDVSANGDITNAWFLRNGAQAVNVTAAGALIGGDATNGLDVDVTRLPALPAGTNNIGDVDVLSEPKSGTATLSNVASSATSVTLLSSNAARLGATVHNDSTQILYVKFGITASATSYTVKMVADAYYEVPFRYTGRIDGIWASANGNARVTELT